MKLHLLALITLGFGLQASAQVVPNGGMETWVNQGLYEEPQFWGTLNIVTAFGAPEAPCQKVTDAHSGTYAARLETVIFGDAGEEDTIPGFMILGTLDIFSGNAEPAPFASRPDSVIFWYKYSPEGEDAMGIGGELTYWDGSERVTIGEFEWSSGDAVNSYTRVAVPINYVSQQMPDSLTIAIISSVDALSGSTLHIDDISTVTNAMAAVNNPKAAEAIRIYPNPAKDELNVMLAKDATVTVYNVLGAHIETIRVTGNVNTQISTERYNNGVYILKTSTGITQRFVVKH